jgi:hypothetical protein
MKLFALVCASVLLVSATPVSTAMTSDETQPSPYTIPLDLVQKIDCNGGSGTASFIDGNTVMTASHVASLGGCRLLGNPLVLNHNSGELDFATLNSPLVSAPDRIPYSCDGIIPGRVYYTVGWALGERFVAVRMIGTGGHWPDGLTRVRGRGMPGMSGGPVFDEHGFVVAIHIGSSRDGSNVAAVRPLAQTYLCGSPNDV